MHALLSIRPQHVRNILNGTKLFEFRRKAFARKVETVVIYCTQPVGKIVAEFDLIDVLSGRPADIWRETSFASGITKDFFDSYFEGRDCAYALQIGEIRRLKEEIDPRALFADFTPPQSYMYIPALSHVSRSSNKSHEIQFEFEYL